MGDTMKQDEIIEMAVQVGANKMVSCLTAPKGPITAINFDLDNGSLEAFAKLVADASAAKERDHIAKYFEKETTHLFEVDGLWIGKTIRRIRARGEQ